MAHMFADDTPLQMRMHSGTSGTINSVSAQRREENAATVLLQARVDPRIRRAVKDAAAESGVSISLYVETLFSDMLAAQGRLPKVHSSRQRPADELPVLEEATTHAA